MTILIDNGHGIDTPGKRSPDGSLREYKWAREVARMVCDILLAMGHDARLLVPEETDVPLAERCRRANRHDKRSSILVSIHNNAAGKGDRWMKARGWRIYTTKGITEADRLAECIWNRAKETFRAPLSVRSCSRLRGELLHPPSFVLPRRPHRELLSGQPGGRRLPQDGRGQGRLRGGHR